MQAPSGQLREFLARTPLPWMFWSEEKQKLILVVDNHLLQTYRACAQHFVYSHVQGYHKRSKIHEAEKQRVWFLDFGIVLHRMFELYYRDFRNPGFDAVEWATSRAVTEWNALGMDVHSEEKEYKLIGGVYGLAGILMQYSAIFTPINEKLRILGQEISFGRAGEVPLYIGEDVEIYLAGRMDLIVDDGYFICPMDHKSEGVFSGDPSLKYETEEGPTGYIYALSKILPTIVPEGEILKRDCSKILMNLIQKTPTTTPQERFKRVSIRKTTAQLRDYQQRMVSTCENLLHDMERVARGLPVQRNTMVCSNWFHRDCVYRDVDRQNGPEAELATLSNGYIKLPIWNTEEVKPIT
jgi:PD-(D/E)XK nuclease superfamily protein